VKSMPLGRQIVILKFPEAACGDVGVHWCWAKDGSFIDNGDGTVTFEELDHTDGFRSKGVVTKSVITEKSIE